MATEQLGAAINNTICKYFNYWFYCINDNDNINDDNDNFNEI